MNGSTVHLAVYPEFRRICLLRCGERDGGRECAWWIRHGEVDLDDGFLLKRELAGCVLPPVGSSVPLCPKTWRTSTDS